MLSPGRDYNRANLRHDLKSHTIFFTANTHTEISHNSLRTNSQLYLQYIYIEFQDFRSNHQSNTRRKQESQTAVFITIMFTYLVVTKFTNSSSFQQCLFIQGSLGPMLMYIHERLRGNQKSRDTRQSKTQRATFLYM